MATNNVENTETVEVILPHIDALKEIEKKKIDKKDIPQTLKMAIGRVQKQCEKAFEGDDEKLQERALSASKTLADDLLKLIANKKPAAKKKEATPPAPTPTQNEQEVNALIEQGDQQMAANSYEAAQQFYNSALQLDPTNTYVQGQLQKIADHAAELATQLQTQQKYEGHINLAVQLMQEGKLTEAREQYQFALEMNPEDKEIIDRIAEIDAHQTGSGTGNVDTVSNSKERLVDIMKDIERVCHDRGKITHQELLDIGLKKYPAADQEFPIGNLDKHGKTITLVKSSEGVYTLKAAPEKKKNNTGLWVGLGLAAAAIVAGIFIFAGKKKKNG